MRWSRDSGVALNEVWAQDARIAARVGTSDELYLAYHQTHDAVGEVYRVTRDVSKNPSTVAPGRLAQAVVVDMPAAFGAFFDATAKRIGPTRG